MADLLFYQKPIGGTSYFGSLERCISESDVNTMRTDYDTTFNPATVTSPILRYDRFGGNVLCSTGTSPSNKLILMNKASDVFYRVSITAPQKDTSAGGTLMNMVEGQTMRFYVYVYNDFNYTLNLVDGVIVLAALGSSGASSGENAFETGDYLNFGTTSITANKSISKQFTGVTVPSPIIRDGVIYNNIWLAAISSRTSLLTSGNTNIGKNLGAIPTTYIGLGNATAWKRPILKRPYVVLEYSGELEVITGQSINITAKIYNANDGKTTLTGGTSNMTRVIARLTLSATGLPNPGTIKYRTGTASTSAQTPEVTINRTTNYNSISYSAVTGFTYTAPTTTSNGTVTITPTVPQWYYNSNPFGDYPGSGSSITLTIRGNSTPAGYYYPFRMYDMDGIQIQYNNQYYLDINNTSMFIGSYDWKEQYEASFYGDVESLCKFFSVHSGNDTVFYVYVPTTLTTSYLENLHYDNCYGFVDVACDFEGSVSDLNRVTGSTYAAMSSTTVSMYMMSPSIEETCNSQLKILADSTFTYLEFHTGSVSYESTPYKVVISLSTPLGTVTGNYFNYKDDGYFSYGSGTKIQLSDIYSGTGKVISSIVVYDSNNRLLVEFSDDTGMELGVDTYLLGEPFADQFGNIPFLANVSWTECIDGLEVVEG